MTTTSDSEKKSPGGHVDVRRVVSAPAWLPAEVARGAACVLFSIALLVAGCGAPRGSASGGSSAAAHPGELNVSAASSLKSLLTTTAASFEKANDVRLVFNFGASGVLQKQIEAGAPVDVFASASAKQVDALIGKDLVSADSTATFAGNSLAILVPAGNPKKIYAAGDLRQATRLATGDATTTPHGAAAKEWLTSLGLWRPLARVFVFTQNAAQTDDYVARGEVDAGIGFVSDARGRTDIQVAYTVPAGEIKPIEYVAAPIKSTKQAELAKKYLQYLLSPDFQSALVSAGFKTAPGSQPGTNP